MALWEYKVITSGIHGFATPALLETYLNNLGKDEWEIVNYHPSPTNALAFTGLVRRPTQRDWTPPIPAVIATAPVSETKPHANASHSETAKPTTAESAQETHTESTASEAAPSAKEAIRTVRDTERDNDPEALAEDDSEDADDEWDNLGIDDDLPTFFDALKPHMRNNQKGPGQSVAVDYLSKRWELREAEIVGALKECGLTIPETEEAEPQYYEFEDDLYWVNRNNRGQLFINTREKPRPVFRTVPAAPLSPDDPAYAELAAERAEELARIEKRNAERAAQQAAQQAAAAARAEEAAKRRAEQQAAAETAAAQPDANATPSTEPAPQTSTPATTDDHPILERIRPLMRRNRHGPGYSGSVGFLARALKTTDADLTAELLKLGLQLPEAPNAKPTFTEIGAALYWLNKDNRGNIWINGRENKNGSKKPAAPEVSDKPTEQPAEQPQGVSEAPASAPQQLELPAAETAQSTANPAPAPADSANPKSEGPLATARAHLKPNKRATGVSGEVGYLARTLEQNETEFVAALTNAGLVVPPDADAKPTFVEHDGEIYWFSFYEKDGATSIWLNAKPAKSKKKPDRAPRSRSKGKTSKPDKE